MNVPLLKGGGGIKVEHFTFHLYPEEPVRVVYLLCDGVDAIIDLEPLVRLAVVLVEFLGNVRADVPKPLLDGLSCFQ